MFDRFHRSVQILTTSAQVLRSDKELMALPLVGSVATLGLSGIFGGAAWLTTAETADGASVEASSLTYVVGAVGTVLIAIVGIFFAAALVAGARQRLTGGEPTLRRALGETWGRLPQIVGWAVLWATVGAVLRFISDRGVMGSVVSGFLQMGWAVLSYLAVPVIVAEGLGPFATLKRSGHLTRTTWGENIIGQVSFFGFRFFVFLLGLAITLGLNALMPAGGYLIGFIFFVAWMTTTLLVFASINGIYRTALYLYATTGEVPSVYTEDQIAAAFGTRAGARSLASALR